MSPIFSKIVHIVNLDLLELCKTSAKVFGFFTGPIALYVLVQMEIYVS